MARPPQEIVELAQSFVCVRVTDLRTLDLARYRFDFDLTFAAMTIDRDGRVLHRFGGRAARDPQSHLSMAALAAFLRGTLEEIRPRRRGDIQDTEPPNLAPQTIESLATFRKRDAEKRVECVHCHTVNDFEHHQAVEDGAWRRERMWVFPDPARLGFDVERDDQQKIAQVEPGSLAAKAGVRAGDRLLAAGTQPLLTRADLQWVLNALPFEGAKLRLDVERAGADGAAGGERRSLTLDLPSGWRVAPPLEYAWRPYKWNLPPHPGFGGKFLDAAQKQALGLKPDAFAQKVDYLVTWGEKAATGKNAQAAGLRKGDVVVAVGGQSDFASEDHFQAWFRITQKVGGEVEIVVLRDGARRTLRMKVID